MQAQQLCFCDLGKLVLIGRWDELTGRRDQMRACRLSAHGTAHNIPNDIALLFPIAQAKRVWLTH